MEDKLRQEGVTVLRSPLRWWIGNPDQLRDYPFGRSERVEKLALLMCECGAEVVVSNTSVIRDAADAARQVGLPHLWYIHEILSRYTALRTPLSLSDVWTQMAELSNAMVCVSKAVQMDICQFAPHVAETCRLEVIHTGIRFKDRGDPIEARTDLTIITGFSTENVIVCFVGVLNEHKGVMTLVDCARHVIHDASEIRFAVIGGDGGAETAFRRSIKEYNLENKFAILGHRDDVQHLMQGADIVVVLSRSEAFPLVVQEAMHLGLPIVAMASGGVEELIEDGKTGYLFPIGDTRAMSECLVSLANDPKRRQLMGERGMRRIRSSFSEERYVDLFAQCVVSIAADTFHKAECP
ncbi:hypothetical protein DSCOOX_15210 [Desulfosarcina ovata subsp. ovata]|uniref:Glycosyl transferase family 1 domain-containing protein n=2 Tax=Desulfosarcina ovata TaxID=83564 RepID=A0A5K8A793_9BACT|nr:hypothetical protein DSCOOX_15210 [Desulfosarcina ovata subsp. ovata]